MPHSILYLLVTNCNSYYRGPSHFRQLLQKHLRTQSHPQLRYLSQSPSQPGNLLDKGTNRLLTRPLCQFLPRSLGQLQRHWHRLLLQHPLFLCSSKDIEKGNHRRSCKAC